MKLGNQLKTALIYCPSGALISRDSARFLPALLVKTSKHVKPRFQPSLGHKQKRTLLWLDVEMANVHSAMKKKPVLTLSSITDEEGYPLENEDDSGRRV